MFKKIGSNKLFIALSILFKKNCGEKVILFSQYVESFQIKESLIDIDTEIYHGS